MEEGRIVSVAAIISSGITEPRAKRRERRKREEERHTETERRKRADALRASESVYPRDWTSPGAIFVIPSWQSRNPPYNSTSPRASFLHLFLAARERETARMLCFAVCGAPGARILGVRERELPFIISSQARCRFRLFTRRGRGNRGQSWRW